MLIRGNVVKNNKTRFFHVLYSDKTWGFWPIRTRAGSYLACITGVIILRISGEQRRKRGERKASRARGEEHTIVQMLAVSALKAIWNEQIEALNNLGISAAEVGFLQVISPTTLFSTTSQHFQISRSILRGKYSRLPVHLFQIGGKYRTSRCWWSPRS